MDLKKMRLDLAERLLRRRIILLDGELNGDTCEFVHTAMLSLDDKANKRITLCFRTPGGNADAGLVLHDTVRMLRSPIIGIVYAAASAACNILQACDKRLIVRSGKILIHSPAANHTNIRFDERYAGHMKSSIVALQASKQRTEEVFLKRTGMNKKDYRKLIQKGDHFTDYIYAERAVKLNLVDDIIPDDFILFKD